MALSSGKTGYRPAGRFNCANLMWTAAGLLRAVLDGKVRTLMTDIMNSELWATLTQGSCSGRMPSYRFQVGADPQGQRVRGVPGPRGDGQAATSAYSPRGSVQPEAVEAQS